MDYQKASGLRKRSLSDLISERLLKSTTTVPTSEGGRPTTTRDYSISGAITSSISEKMRASATGLKEKFDPMNIARAFTGGSPLAAALVGRMTGRKPEEMEYFAGKGKKKRAGRKDPDYSSIGDGASAKLRVGDSYSDVLAKMFLFLQHTQEFDKLSYELEKDFRSEQKAEDDRRHKKLIDAILSTKKGKPVEGKKDNTESFLEKLMEKMTSIVSGLWDAIKFLGSSASNIAAGVAKMFDKMKDSIITGMVSTSTYVTKKILKLALGAIVDSLSFMLPGVGQVIGRAILAGLAAAGITEGISEFKQAEREAYGGTEAEKTYQEIQKYEGSGAGMNFTGEPTEEAAQKIKELTEKRNQQILDYQQKYMDPTMQKLGWTKEGYQTDSTGNTLYDKPIYTKMQNGKKVTAGILDAPEVFAAGAGAHMRKGVDYSEAIREQEKQLRERFGSSTTDKSEILKPEASVGLAQSASALSPLANKPTYTLQSPVDIATRLIENKPDVVVSAKRPAVVNTTNNVGGQGETFKTSESIDVRNRDKAFNHSTSAAALGQ